MIKIKTKIGNIAGDYIDCGSDSPLLIIAHGRGGHRNTGSKKIAEYMQTFAISSLRIDLYGYGESDGMFEDITISTSKESILGAINYAQKNINFKNLFIFGTSYGGSGILGAINEISPNEVSGIILRCTILDYLKKTEREMSYQKILKWKTDGSIDDYEGKLKYSFFEDMKNYTKVNFAQLRKFNTLYFHAGKDTKVLMSEVKSLKVELGNKLELVTYPNSAHGIDIDNDFKDMLIKTKEFVQRNTE